MRKFFAYLKAIWPLLLVFFLMVGGIVAFFYLVTYVGHTPLPLIGMAMVAAGFFVLVASDGSWIGEWKLVTIKYSDGEKAKKKSQIKNQKYVRKEALRQLHRNPDSEHYYRAVCKAEAEIAALKGKRYRYPDYQPGPSSEW